MPLAVQAPVRAQAVRWVAWWAVLPARLAGWSIPSLERALVQAVWAACWVAEWVRWWA